MMHAPVPADTESPRPIVIDVAGQPVGVVVRQNARYRFIAVKLPAFAIDGAEFDDPESARIAAVEAHARHDAVAAE
jgi:hypothetical protein